MKIKYADYPTWDRVKEKSYINKYFDNEDFKGNISLLTAVKVKEKLVVDDNLVIMDDGFEWLEIYPDNNKNIAVSVCISDKKEIREWYFDIAKDSRFNR
jgi:predicted RNA-binding protein associated with RNAse of E/G family